MTVEAMPFVAEKTMAPVSADQCVDAAAVGPARPDVDDGLAVQVDRKRPSAVAGTGKHLAEGPYRTGEVRVGRALNTVWRAPRCAPRCQSASQCI